MNTRPRSLLTWTGLLLIVVTNSVTLALVAYNRRLPAENELQLTERELRSSYEWSPAKENSGLDLQFRIRTAAPLWIAKKIDGRIIGEMFDGEMPWLNDAKLKSLGFDISRALRDRHDERGYKNLASKAAYVVLELNGDNYRAEVNRLQAGAARSTKAAAERPDDKELAERARTQQNDLSREQNEASRLFCVDAGVDGEALRKQYPDRSRYAIVSGRIGVRISAVADTNRVRPYFAGLQVSRLNVPFDFRSFFKTNTGSDIYRPAPNERYEVTVDWGKRSEPWITAVSPRAL